MNARARIGTAAGLVLLTALSVVRVTRPPSPAPAASPDTVFAAERALRHVEQIAGGPHPMGTEAHDRARDYIVAQLTALGIRPQIQVTTAVGTRYQSSGRVQNILAYLPGSSSNGKAVLVVVHYDGVGAGPAAADDGAGVGALLETLRALRARKTPLAHDVIALFTDGEEDGLLGAAAFVREHRWAKDVAVALNFEARGTKGRSYMFETGPGNLDAARVLRSAGDVTAGSVFTTIYRLLPNDTDLSELSVLGVPALNFAFTGGVERYHTSRDDVAHLDPGSVQHHGRQMLALTTAFANGELPRPKTGDAVFFDLPLIGLIVYPTWLAIPILLLAVALAFYKLPPVRKDTFIVAGAMLAALAITALLARFVRLNGAAMWSGRWGLAVALGVIALNLAGIVLIRRRWPHAYGGVLIVWLLLAAATSIFSPGLSYPFVWPLLFMLIAARSEKAVAEWLAAAIALLMLAGFTYAVGVIMLGLNGGGVMAFAVLIALQVWLLAPMLGEMFYSMRSIAMVGATAIVVAIVSAFTVGQNADHPLRSSIIYAEHADASDAYLGAWSTRDEWTRGALGTIGVLPDWTRELNAYPRALRGHVVPRAGLEAPTMTYIRDTIIDNARRVIVRVNAPHGTTAVVVRALGVHVSRAAIDARVVDTARFRNHLAQWTTEFHNVPDSGVVFSLAIPVGAKLDLEIAARRPGLPPSVVLPKRPDFVVPSQDGDVSIVYRRAMF
jgi:hypothetical protein